MTMDGWMDKTIDMNEIEQWMNGCGDGNLK